jgi:hypothetical protein
LSANHARYDAIFLDAYRQPYIPFYLVTEEFFATVRAHLRPGGVLIINVGHVPGSDALERVVTATARTAFPVIWRDVVTNGNTLLVASAAPLSAARMESRPVPGLRRLAARVAGHLRPPLGGGSVFTDDRAPVEWLTDLSLVQYAEGRR